MEAINMSKCECEHHCHCHENVKKVVLVDAIMQKKIANVETAKQVIVTVISTLLNKERDLKNCQISFFELVYTIFTILSSIYFVEIVKF